MKKTETYLTQYCNMDLEWDRKGINIDTASEEQISCIKNLQAKAVEQSGLSLNELVLIVLCRKYRLFKKLNSYLKKQINSL